MKKNLTFAANLNGGDSSPLFLWHKMISKEHIVQLAEKKAHDLQAFLVDVKISSSNQITIELDSFSGITIKDCADVSRYIEGGLNRDETDFELSVSSPGLENPFKVFEQYQKSIDKKVRIVMHGGAVLEGKLLQVDKEGIQIETEKTARNTQTKKKEIIKTEHSIPFAEIKQTNRIITFTK